MVNTQEEADCGACSLVRFFFAKEMNEFANTTDLFIFP